MSRGSSCGINNRRPRRWDPSLARAGTTSGTCWLGGARFRSGDWPLSWLLASAWSWLEWRTVEQQIGPAVIVLPFEPLTGGEGGPLLASGLTNGLIANLMPFDGIQVFAGLPAGQGRAELPPAAEATPAYVVTGSIERTSDRVRVPLA